MIKSAATGGDWNFLLLGPLGTSVEHTPHEARELWYLYTHSSSLWGAGWLLVLWCSPGSADFHDHRAASLEWLPRKPPGRDVGPDSWQLADAH